MTKEKTDMTSHACTWCGTRLNRHTAATMPVVVILKTGHQVVVCPKCWRFDDGDR